ncbi:large ribosomal subunit protein uL15m [Centruroides vittatus]|uniref:large ribosomal subunit protein uL15m n=1 Tax=Centruroides vittatus TaxID=120091 RepID=UPI0035109025
MVVEKGLELLRYLPRVYLTNLKYGPHPFVKNKYRRGQHGGKTRGYSQKGSYQRQNFPRLGFEGDKLPFYLRIPIENYYKNHHVRRQYPPLSLTTLQLMLDTNRINSSEPIDLITLCNTNVYHMHPKYHHYGVHLTDEGMDDFSHKINIEVQYVTEPVIAAIERNGGVITTAYYDMESLVAMVNPLKFFSRGM